MLPFHLCHVGKIIPACSASEGSSHKVVWAGIHARLLLQLENECIFGFYQQIKKKNNIRMIHAGLLLQLENVKNNQFPCTFTQTTAYGNWLLVILFSNTPSKSDLVSASCFPPTVMDFPWWLISLPSPSSSSVLIQSITVCSSTSIILIS